MKRVLLFGVSIIFIMLIIPFALAEVNNTKIDNAYDCLEKKVEDKTCSKLSLEERIFSLLAINECKNEIEESSEDDECWPSGSGDCSIKTTAQAILALNEAGGNTGDAESWLLSHNKTPSDINWFLQIESSEAAACTITYSGSPYTVNIGENKKIDSNAGSCLSLDTIGGGYWLEISPRCYNNEFEISCDKGFLTSLLFKEEGSSTIHVSEKTTSASGGDGSKTKETINSFCFSSGRTDACDYEGSLWAALVLYYLDYDVSFYLPYLVTMAEKSENRKYLPEAFLYILTSHEDFRNDLLLKQKSSKWWLESGNKFYDTSLALYPFQYEDPLEKTNAINWLLEPGVQDNNGCWDNGNIRNTAFLLHSVWSRDFNIGDGDDDEDGCEESGNYCMSGIDCEGQTLSGYSCSGVYKCCDTEKKKETCGEMNGDICNSAQNCVGGRTEEAFGLEYGESCCIGGVCKKPEQVEESECEYYGGTCKSSCGSDEEENNDNCDSSSDVCCVEKTSSPKSEGKSYFWIWVLLVLILLAVLGIVFRDKIRPYWFRIKSKFGKGRKGGEDSGFGFRGPGRRPPPGSGFLPSPLRRMPQRRIPLRQGEMQRESAGRRPAEKQKPKGELDDVLKKLKEMGS